MVRRILLQVGDEVSGRSRPPDLLQDVPFYGISAVSCDDPCGASGESVVETLRGRRQDPPNRLVLNELRRDSSAPIGFAPGENRERKRPVR
jgi:hypothetical protein